MLSDRHPRGAVTNLIGRIGCIGTEHSALGHQLPKSDSGYANCRLVRGHNRWEDLILRGRRIELRPISVDDAGLLADWHNDPLYHQGCVKVT